MMRRQIVLWRNTTDGTVGVWTMNGGQVSISSDRDRRVQLSNIDRDFGALSNGDLGNYFLIA